MIKYTSHSQISIDAFKTPFECNLSPNNRWVKLSQTVPWDALAAIYMRSMDSSIGRTGVSPQVIIGAMIIKHKQKLSDDETIDTISENPYMQYFLGLKEFQQKHVFDSSLFVTIRKRMTAKVFDEFNQEVIRSSEGKKDQRHNSKNKDENGDSKNKGKLQLDATVADQEIKYPTDPDLLNQAREISEKIIDKLHKDSDIDKKPRTYRRVARKDYLNLSKKRQKSKKDIRRCIKHQLQYLHRNIKSIDQMLDNFKEFPLTGDVLKKYWVIQHVYAQQSQMYVKRENRCNDRIVSISQPHVRPIVRGKQKAKVEFGSKLGLSLSNGFSRIGTMSWDAYNESTDLIKQVEQYKQLHGHYPELVLVDQIYATLANRKFLKEHNIRITAKPLGRPKKRKEETCYQRRKRIKEFHERNHVEGKFGQAKRGYNMNNIQARRRDTSESWISCIIFVLNIIQLQKIFFIFIKSKKIIAKRFEKLMFDLSHFLKTDKSVLVFQ
ncbi:MAG: IS5 family transposase [Bacteroidales bacterium]|jgi:IS5 family transposase|nr:IS5 family transposase [Bacteroidales bacterium]